MKRYFVAHLPDAPGVPWKQSDPNEEIYVVPLLGEKTVFPVPIGALGRALPVFAEAAADLPPATCPCCGEELPAPRGRA